MVLKNIQNNAKIMGTRGRVKTGRGWRLMLMVRESGVRRVDLAFFWGGHNLSVLMGLRWLHSPS